MMADNSNNNNNNTITNNNHDNRSKKSCSNKINTNNNNTSIITNTTISNNNNRCSNKTPTVVRVQPCCGTPNVPRIRDSFFNRKYRDLTSTCQMTPKVTRNNTTSNRSLNRSGARNSSNGLQTRTRSRNQNGPSHDESIDPEYSTPKTTRTTLTPVTGSKLRNYTKPTLIYRPLELDNESSSESSDGLLRRRDNFRVNSQIISTPLAIEAPPMIFPAPTNDPPSSQLKKSPHSITDEHEIKETREDSDTVSTPNPAKRRKNDHTSPAPKSVSTYTEKKSIGIVQVSQCMTPPITPEKSATELDDDDEVVVLAVKLPTFIPGNCNIQEVLRLYGSKEDSDPSSKFRKKSGAV